MKRWLDMRFGWRWMMNEWWFSRTDRGRCLVENGRICRFDYSCKLKCRLSWFANNCHTCWFSRFACSRPTVYRLTCRGLSMCKPTVCQTSHWLRKQLIRSGCHEPISLSLQESVKFRDVWTHSTSHWTSYLHGMICCRLWSSLCFAIVLSCSPTLRPSRPGLSWSGYFLRGNIIHKDIPRRPEGRGRGRGGGRGRGRGMGREGEDNSKCNIIP